MPKRYNTSIEVRNDKIWITFEDPIDMDNYKAVEEAILYAIKKNKEEKVILDLSKTMTLFSSGIGVILRIHSFASQYKRKMILVNISPRVLEAFKTTGLDQMFTIFPNSQELDTTDPKQ